jgi:metal transporter CNNM
VTAANKPNQVIGLLLIKKLLRYDPSTKQTVGQLPLSLLPEARPDINCFQALDYFQTGRSHLLLLTKNPGKPSDNFPAGVVTLEGKQVNLLIRWISADMHFLGLRRCH